MDHENMDSMSPADLALYAGERAVLACQAVSERDRKGLSLTVQYCINKAAAMRARLAGDIPSALKLENLCDKLYDQMPIEFRW